MNFWLKMSRLGIKNDMPFYLQKSIILYNQIIRLLMLFFTGAIFFLYFIWNIAIVPVFFIAILFVLGFTLLLNYKGKVGLSILIISLVLPVFFLLASIISKANGANQSVYLYLIPRLLILLVTILPAALIGFYDIKKAIAGTSLGLLSFILYDVLHKLFGVQIKDLPYLEFKSKPGSLGKLKLVEYKDYIL